MTPSSTLAPGRIVAGRYRVERQIGAGGVGSVYLVRHVHTEEELALKVLQTHALRNSDAVERFRKEARAPARIASEHVTRVTDADTAPDLDNAPFLVMELLRGRDLTRVVEESGPLAPTLVVELLRQAARALDKAHGLGIIHRDLKPDNLFLTTREDGTACIKLLDFGIARIDEESPSKLKTPEGLVVGTPGYMAPEQMSGEMELISPATDVWALGLVAYYLLVGEDFWSATTLAQLYAMVLTEPVALPSQRGSKLGEAFDLWFQRCVARDPKDRFQTAGEAVAALSRALRLRVSSPAVSLPPLDKVARRAEEGAPTQGAELPRFRTESDAPVARYEAPPRRSRAVLGVAALLGLVGALVSVVALVGFVVGFGGLTSRDADAGVTSTSAPTENAASAPAPVATHTTHATTSAPSRPWSESPRATETQEGTPPAANEAPGPGRSSGAARGASRHDQQERLDALQRLCDQGTVTAAECAAKRLRILRGDP